MPSRPQRRIPSTVDGLGRTDTLTVGARKALGNFIADYGAKKGVAVFIAKADERGTGTTLRKKVNSVYKKGASLG
jgi:hypothetical protein